MEKEQKRARELAVKLVNQLNGVTLSTARDALIEAKLLLAETQIVAPIHQPRRASSRKS
jgi:hypothetical protein